MSPEECNQEQFLTFRGLLKLNSGFFFPPVTSMGFQTLHTELLPSCSEKGMEYTLKTAANIQFRLISTASNHSDGEHFINLHRCLSEGIYLQTTEELI